MLQIKYSHDDTGKFPVYTMSYVASGIKFDGLICWSYPTECRIFSVRDEFSLLVNNVEYYVSNLILTLKDRWAEGGEWKRCWDIEYPLSIYPRGTWGADYSAQPTDSARKKIKKMVDLLAFHLESGTFTAQQFRAYDAQCEYHLNCLQHDINEQQKKLDAIVETRNELEREHGLFLINNFGDAVTHSMAWFIDESEKEIELLPL